MKKIYVLLVIGFFITCSMNSDKKAYLIFDKNGSVSAYEDIINAAKSADIVLFGEMHNNPICHWLEYEIANDLYKIKGQELIMGAEMFETDNQLLIDEYISGKIKESNFEAEVKLWPNYKSDYKPLVNFAKKNKIKFIASNIPRRYASLVGKYGFETLDSLSDEAKELIAPLPIKYDSELNCYKNMMKMSGDTSSNMHKNQNLPKAQAVKDATMANSILKYLKKNQLCIHFNGTYHSENFESMIWYLKEMKPKLKIISIASVEQEDISSLSKENLNKADFILCIPENMTRNQ